MYVVGDIQNVVSVCQTCLNVDVLWYLSTFTSCSWIRRIVNARMISSTHLEYEVNHGTGAASHEAQHHPLALMPCRQMSLDEDNERQRECSASEVVLDVVLIQDKPDELHREADPEEEIKLDETEEDLVVREHGLDAAVRAKELVGLPTKLGIDSPAQRNVGNLGDRDDDGDYEGEGVDGYV